MEIYVVKAGDTLSSIARSFGVSERRIIYDNGLETNRLVIGQALIILFPAEIYTARRGDSIFSISQDFNTTVDALLRNNPWLASTNSINAGEALTVSYVQEPSYNARINGYAYPFISEPFLKRQLPFLSTLTVFGYGFTITGELIEADDDRIVKTAIDSGVVPILLLSSITESGNFDSERASLLFNSNQLQDSVLSSILYVMKNKGYGGLDIDFEYVLPEDAEGFINFVRKAADVMHQNGFFVNVDLAPKTSVNQRGLLYEAHDYKALGEAADTVLLMTYEWGYAYGPPLAIAPITEVSRVVDFALSQIPAYKIMLGIPNYGYNWTLPFQKGITKAVTIGNQYAVTVADRVGAQIQYDEISQAPFYEYRDMNRAEHIVWFEDVRSILAKIKLAENNGLLGIGYWNLMRPFAQNWALLSVETVPVKV